MGIATSPLLVNVDTESVQDDPIVVRLADGRLLVVWSSFLEEFTRNHLFARFLDAEGQPIGAPFAVFPPGSLVPGAGSADVVALAGGGFAVTWTGDRAVAGAPEAIYLRVFAADGTPLGPVAEVLDNFLGVNRTPALHETAAGGLLVTWIRSEVRLGGEINLIARGFDATGAPMGPSMDLSAAMGRPAGFDQQLVTLAGGGFVSAFQVPGPALINAQRFSDDATPIGPAFVLDQKLPGMIGQRNMALAPLADGGFVATWLESTDVGPVAVLRARIFNPDMTPRGGSFDVIGATLEFLATPAVTVLGGDRLLFAWAELGAGVDTIRLRMFDAAGQPLTDVQDAVAAEVDIRQHSPIALREMADGRTLLSWSDALSTEGDVFAAVLDTRGFRLEVSVFTDGNGNGRRDPAEGEVGVAIRVGERAGQTGPDGRFDLVRAFDPQPATVEVEITRFGTYHLIDVTPREATPRVALVDGTRWSVEGADATLRAGARDATLDGRGDHDLIGSRADNHLVGNAGANMLLGLAGDDLLWGRAGDDRLDGGGGNDTLVGGAGNDLLNGAAGDDRLFGGDGDDRLSGGLGDDWLSGGAGDDRLEGGAGNDRLVGGPGNDRLRGGPGHDLMKGGPGADTFFFGRGEDSARILDFSIAEGDRLFLQRSLWTGTRGREDVIAEFGTGLILADGSDAIRFEFAGGENLFVLGPSQDQLIGALYFFS